MKNFKQIIEYRNEESLGRMIVAICGDRIICRKITGCNVNFYSLLDYLLSNLEVQRRLIMFSETEYSRQQIFNIRIEESRYHDKNIYYDACDNELEYVKYSEKILHISSNDKIDSFEMWLGDFIEMVAKVKTLKYHSSWKSDIREIDTLWGSGSLECSDITTLINVDTRISIARRTYAKYSSIKIITGDCILLYVQSPSIDGYWSKTQWSPSNGHCDELVIFDRGVALDGYSCNIDEEIIDSLELENDLHTIRCEKQDWVEK